MVCKIQPSKKGKVSKQNMNYDTMKYRKVGRRQQNSSYRMEAAHIAQQMRCLGRIFNTPGNNFGKMVIRLSPKKKGQRDK